MPHNNFQNGKKWKGKASLCIHTDTHEFFYPHPRLTGQKSDKARRSNPVWLEGLNPSLWHFVTRPCVTYTPDRPLVGSMDTRRPTLSFYCTEPSVSWPLPQQGWRDEKKPQLCHRNKKRETPEWEDTESRVSCAGCVLDRWPWCLSSSTQPKLIDPASQHCSAARNSTAQTSFYSFQARANTPICTSWASKGSFCYHNLLRIRWEDVTDYSGKCWIVLLPERALFRRGFTQSKYMAA